MISVSDVVIVAGMDVGDGNIVNMEALLECPDIPVYVVGEFSDYTSGGRLDETIGALKGRVDYNGALRDICKMISNISIKQ
jgi:hypothetical protein